MESKENNSLDINRQIEFPENQTFQPLVVFNFSQYTIENITAYEKKTSGGAKPNAKKVTFTKGSLRVDYINIQQELTKIEIATNDINIPDNIDNWSEYFPKFVVNSNGDKSNITVFVHKKEKIHLGDKYYAVMIIQDDPVRKIPK